MYQHMSSMERKGLVILEVGKASMKRMGLGKAQQQHRHISPYIDLDFTLPSAFKLDARRNEG